MSELQHSVKFTETHRQTLETLQQTADANVGRVAVLFTARSYGGLEKGTECWRVGIIDPQAVRIQQETNSAELLLNDNNGFHGHYFLERKKSGFLHAAVQLVRHGATVRGMLGGNTGSGAHYVHEFTIHPNPHVAEVFEEIQADHQQAIENELFQDLNTSSAV